MKIQLPNGKKRVLESGVNLEEKKKIVEKLIDEYEKEIDGNWNSQAIRYFLDNLANYLIWHKEEEDKFTEDKEVLSITKSKQLDGKIKSKEVPFTYLSKDEKSTLFGEVSESEKTN